MFCEYCGAEIDSRMDKCPSCGATNANVIRTTSDQPLTIEQFVDWYKSKSLPPYEVTRFFIGVDYKEPRAFGIYKEPGGKCIVYMNTDKGNRKIRYEGYDEVYAVNTLYQRLKDEIMEQKELMLKKRQERQGR